MHIKKSFKFAETLIDLNNNAQRWFYLILLSLVWGSSFILIKKALLGLTPIQLGGLRIVFASLILFIFGFQSLKTVQRKDVKWIIAAGLLSSFFPPFLFAIAQTEIDSGVTSIFNSVVPLLTTGVGILAFGAIVSRRQVLGVVIGLLGTVALILAGMEFKPDRNYAYATLILISALGYAININIVKSRLAHLTPLSVTTASFGVAFLPSLVIIFFSGFLEDVQSKPEINTAIWYLLALAVIGTAAANILFNKLIHLSSPIFAASVSYLIPIVAVLWAILDGEVMNAYQLFGGVIILLGVWLVNRKKKAQKVKEV